MSQPIPIEKFTVNLLRIQVPTDGDHPHSEAVMIEFTPLDNRPKVWLMLSPAECIALGQGMIAEGELARTGIIMPSDW